MNCYQGIFVVEGKDTERYESRDEQKAYINTIEKKRWLKVLMKEGKLIVKNKVFYWGC